MPAPRAVCSLLGYLKDRNPPGGDRAGRRNYSPVVAILKVLSSFIVMDLLTVLIAIVASSVCSLLVHSQLAFEESSTLEFWGCTAIFRCVWLAFCQSPSAALAFPDRGVGLPLRENENFAPTIVSCVRFSSIAKFRIVDSCNWMKFDA